MRMIRLLFLLLLTLAATAAPRLSASARQYAAPPDSIAAYLDAMAVFGFTGAVLVARNGVVIHEQGYGFANVAARVPVTKETPFLIGSLSKQFTAAAILRLVEQGRLRVGDPVRNILPEAPDALAAVTVHQLLTHTAGLPYLPDAHIMAIADRAQLFRRVLTVPVDAQRLGVHAYSNIGYVLLAAVIERTSGTTYEKYLMQELLQPAGLTHTGFMGEERWRAVPTHSYSGDADEGPLAAFPIASWATGTGNVVSTVGDLFKWVQALDSGRVLSPASLALLFTAHTTPPAGPAYGYGWMVTRTTRGTSLVFHGGDLGGYNAELRSYRDEGITTIVLSNRRVDGIGHRSAVLNPIALRLIGSPHPAPPTVRALDAASLARLQGEYVLPTRGRLRILGSAAGAVLVPEGQDAITLATGMPPAAADAARTIGQRADTVLAALVRGDYNPLLSALTPAVPTAVARAGLETALAQLAGSLGRPLGVTVLGTAVRSPQAAATAFRLRHERGESVGRIGWVGNSVASFEFDRAAPIAVPLALRSDGVLVAFDIFTGVALALRPEADAAALVIETAAGPIRAERVQRQ